MWQIDQVVQSVKREKEKKVNDILNAKDEEKRKEEELAYQ